MEDKSPKRGRKPLESLALRTVYLRMEDKSPKRGRKQLFNSIISSNNAEWKISPRRGDGNLILREI